MRPCATGVFLTACVFIVLSFVPTTLQGAGRKVGGRQGKTNIVVKPIKYCNLERCRRTCYGQKNFQEESVEDAFCNGTQCVCKYKLACDVSDCYQKCAREKFVDADQDKRLRHARMLLPLRRPMREAQLCRRLSRSETKKRRREGCLRWKRLQLQMEVNEAR
ncbi:hypothetical protein MTO96_005729 [Rhipicephalus appendiculatus]